jgi:protoporphyrinogen/coproporphyrinogen III oxidase
MMTKRIVVIGGGIAGLAAAYYSQKLAGEMGLPVHLSVLERGTYWGGKITTERVDGFVIEGGPDTFLATKPWGVALCRELGLESRLQGTDPHHKNTYVLHNGHLLRLPDGLTMMVPTQFGPLAKTRLLSWSQKARVGLDYFLPPAPLNGDESLGAFVSRRLGRAAYENLIEPLMSGIYAGDGDQLSLQATFSYLRDLELKYRGLVRGALATRQQMSASSQRAAGSRSVFLTPRTGLAEIIEALVQRLENNGAELRNGTAVTSLTFDNGSFHLQLETGENLSADCMILATPAFVTGELLEGMDTRLASELRAIEYATTATISLAYRQDDLPNRLDGYGYVIPRRAGHQALACTWTSTKFPHRAPAGYALLRVFAGRAGQETQIPWDEDGLLNLAKDELRQTLGIVAEPVLSRIFRWERAMPQYNLGHPERLARIEEALLELPGLALAGNGYRGIGIPDCIHSGELAARRILESFRQPVENSVS